MRVLTFLMLFLPVISCASEKKLVSDFFGLDGIQDKKSVYAGEMLEHYLKRPTLGEGVPKDVKRTFRIIEATDAREIYAVLLSKGANSQDWYIYLTNSKEGWKISAVRNLALPELFFMALQDIEGKPKRDKEEEYQYQNMLLTIKSDAELKAYFMENLDVIKSISLLAKNKLDEANAIAKSINLNMVGYDAETGIVDVSVGGMLDNSVGFLFVPKGVAVPTMSDDNYIYLEHMNDHWYIYKTT